jgi:hypothetical protein
MRPVTPSTQVRSPAIPDTEFQAQSTSVDVSLNAWRCKAAEVVLMVVAASHLPVIVIAILGHGPRMGFALKGVGLAAYVVVSASALLRHFDYRARLLASFFASYTALTLVNLVFPHGPYAQIGTIAMPIFALVLLGVRAGRITTLISIAILVIAPVLRTNSYFVGALGFDAMDMSDPPGLHWFRTSVKVACLIGLMVLVHRFHRFLSDALRARIDAQGEMVREMRERQRLERVRNCTTASASRLQLHCCIVRRWSVARSGAEQYAALISDHSRLCSRRR